MAIKYSISENNRTTEFATLAEAEAYKTANSLSEAVVEIEFEDVVMDLNISVTARQIRLALFQMGITPDTVLDALNSLPEPTRTIALIEWQYTDVFRRDNELANDIIQNLGWTSAQLDDLFILASGF